MTRWSLKGDYVPEFLLAAWQPHGDDKFQLWLLAKKIVQHITPGKTATCCFYSLVYFLNKLNKQDITCSLMSFGDASR